MTHVLRDSFVSKSDKSKIIMISCVSPSYCSSNHSINTLRYSDRLKEKTSMMNKQVAKNKNHVNEVYNNNPRQKFEPKKEKNLDNLKEIDDINTDVFNIQDDILNEIKFDDKIDINDYNNSNTESLNIKDTDKNTNNNINLITPQKESDEIAEEVDDLIYLKKTVSKEGKYISDDFIKYHQLTDKIVEDEDEIVNTHMNVIKEDAKFLTEESELITKIKRIENNPEDEDFKMEEYLIRLEQIIDKKIFMYSGLKNKLDIYKEHIKQEDEMRKEHPQLFVDAAEL